MAIWTTCPRCKKKFSAQDTYIGKKVKCPSCHMKVAVLALEDQEARDEWQREQEQRLALFQEVTEARQKAAQASYALEFGTGFDKVRNFNPGAISRFQKLRALSRFMILGAYFLFALFVALAAIAVGLHSEGVVTNTGLLLIILLGLTVLLVFSFFLFKFLGELSWLIADVGDQQADVRNLLLDIRDDLDRMLARGSEPARKE